MYQPLPVILISEPFYPQTNNILVKVPVYVAGGIACSGVLMLDCKRLWMARGKAASNSVIQIDDPLEQHQEQVSEDC